MLASHLCWCITKPEGWNQQEVFIQLCGVIRHLMTTSKWAFTAESRLSLHGEHVIGTWAVPPDTRYWLVDCRKRLLVASSEWGSFLPFPFSVMMINVATWLLIRKWFHITRQPRPPVFGWTQVQVFGGCMTSYKERDSPHMEEVQVEDRSNWRRTFTGPPIDRF